MSEISVVLATFNEEENLAICLESIKNIADEIIVVDGSSTDKTIEVAKKFGAKVVKTDNPPIFHINKQKALNLATKDWILQLDADERVTKELASEIKKTVLMSTEEIEDYQKRLKEKNLFLRHQGIIEKRDGVIGTKEGEYSAFFVARLNYFLGKYLRYGGVYPDGVIRLVRKGKAFFPCKSVHEQIVIKGKVGWLQNPLVHISDPSFKRYLKRNWRYSSLIANELKDQKTGFNPFVTVNYLLILPVRWFFLTYFRHKGFLDLWQGFIFSFFSSLRFPTGYIKYIYKEVRS